MTQSLFTTAWRGRVAVLHCGGRIVFGPEVDELRIAVLSLLKETHDIILNLSGVEALDSTGLGALVAMMVSAKNRHATLKLACLSSKARQALEVSQVITLFSVYGTEDEAVASAPPEAASG